MAQCQGITRGGQRCKITAASNMRDDRGRLVAAPLAFGCPCCTLHGRPFCTQAAKPEGQLLPVFLDFEATGVDPCFDRICEFAAIACAGPPEAPPPAFSTVVFVQKEFLEAHGAKAELVHGIHPDEIKQGPDLASAFGRFLNFVDGLLDTAVRSDTDSEDDDGGEKGRWVDGEVGKKGGWRDGKAGKK